ncbi:MAG: formylglycine-generating enzyme family protein, partial [Candidatus Promineifilaceae bacterium]
EQLEIFHRAIWLQAAENYELGGGLREAAHCWEQGGNLVRASQLYEQLGALHEAADLQLRAAIATPTTAAYVAALTQYQTWQATLAAEDVLAHVEAQLGQAACHLLADLDEVLQAPLDIAAGHRLLYNLQETLLIATYPAVTLARCWEALGRYGNWMERFDLLHVGYEMALDQLDTTRHRQTVLDILKVYHRDAGEWRDRLLIESIVERWVVLTSPAAVVQPAWWAWRDKIEADAFRDGVRDVLHFMTAEQRAAWDQLAVIENEPDIDAYLRTLAPPDMVYIPPGAFLMGSAADDPDADDNEKPQHMLWLAGYYIDRYPVTNARYNHFRAINGQAPQELERLDHPVRRVDWNEALAYACWAHKTLPSEAHWEKAASWDPVTQTKRRYPWGNRWLADHCNTEEAGHATTVPVSAYSPQGDSAYGVADLAGNVNEWCSTRWYNEEHEAYQYPYRADDGREDLAADNDILRVIRGGDYYDTGKAKWGRCGFRYRNVPRGWDINYGFRCQWPHAFSYSPSGS